MSTIIATEQQRRGVEKKGNKMNGVDGMNNMNGIYGMNMMASMGMNRVNEWDDDGLDVSLGTKYDFEGSTI